MSGASQPIRPPIFAKTSFSFGHFAAGLMLDYFVRLPFEAVPGEVPDDVLMRFGITAGPALISLLLYARYQLTREPHAEVLAELAQREAR